MQRYEIDGDGAMGPHSDGEWIYYEDAEQVERALIKASEAYSEFAGSCPLDMHDVFMDCEKRCDHNQPAKCWQEYFLKQGR